MGTVAARNYDVNLRQVALTGGILLVLAFLGANTGLFSISSETISIPPGNRLALSTCTQTDVASFTCSTQSGTRGADLAEDYGSGALDTEFDELPASVYTALEQGGIVFADPNNDGDANGIANPDLWEGRCVIQYEGAHDEYPELTAVAALEGRLAAANSFGCIDVHLTDLSCASGVEDCQNLLQNSEGSSKITYVIEHDTDADGIVDKNDACPETAGDGSDGCPIQSSEPVEEPIIEPVDDPDPTNRQNDTEPGFFQQIWTAVVQEWNGFLQFLGVD